MGFDVDQQIQMLLHNGWKRVDAEDVKEQFLHRLQQHEFENISYEEAVSSYDNSPALQNLAELYHHQLSVDDLRVSAALQAYHIEADIDSSVLVDEVYYDDSSINGSTVADDKYGFSNVDEEVVLVKKGDILPREYSYSTNKEYTRIEQSSAGIDTFASIVMYLRGIIDKEVAIKTYDYIECLDTSSTFKQYIIYEDDVLVIKK